MDKFNNNEEIILQHFKYFFTFPCKKAFVKKVKGGAENSIFVSQGYSYVADGAKIEFINECMGKMTQRGVRREKVVNKLCQ